MENEHRQTTSDTTGATDDRDDRHVDVNVNMDGGGATALNVAPNIPAARAVDTTEIAIGGSVPAQAPNPDDTAGAALIQSLRERRLITLALADQVGEDRWRAATLPHDRSLHDLLGALLAWDEWAAAIFEVSLLRALPSKLIAPTQAAEARHDFEARAFARYAPLARAEMLASLQVAEERAISGAIGRGAVGWHGRRIAGLALFPLRDQAPDVAANTAPRPTGAAHGASNVAADVGAGVAAQARPTQPTEPTIGDILRWLMAREERRDAAISAGLHVATDIEQLRARFTREGAAQR